ncbi:ATP-binding cassette domain-containing protein [Williamsia deligens]|uniref:ATP-binding cassette domain-containing protein n=1 Tax=Williamsia deligens TaxID=321325 RepID=A0ABW3G8P3_9NOCA|nr:ATP-binding cassette domain-containing protein [Williamsia deligens]MCP2192705.1 ABC-type multidrug transport system, ATPase and permease component [Williamsia deligens]
MSLAPAPERTLSRASVAAADDARATVDWRRMRGRAMTVALVLLVVASIAEALGTVVVGRVADTPTLTLVVVLGVTLVGSAVLDAIGRTVWTSVSDRAEGALRDDLLTASLGQPLSVLSETAVGEILDRVDDDTHEVGSLVRLQLWDALRTVVLVIPMWIVAGLTWWPAWLLFPIVASATLLSIRPLLGVLTERKVVEEMAWTDHAAALEEGIAARDDLRTSLGQAFVVRRNGELAAAVHRAFLQVVRIQARMTVRAGLLLHLLMAVIAVAGALLVAGRHLEVGALVTLFLVSTTFVGQINQLARHLPDLQAGMGAIIRLRQLLASPPEPTGGRPLPAGPLDVDIRDLEFSYAEGTFALAGIDLHIEAGTTCALVGRTGSGKSTLAALISRAVDPPRGSVHLGGVDVDDLDLHGLRSAVGVVTQKTEIVAGTLAQNIALFGDVPRDRIADAVADLQLTDWVAGLPAGLDTPLGPGGTTLSAGEEQLVAFARLLVRDVRIVVLDEATARMDPLTEARVVRAADRLLAQRTGLLIAHRLSTVARADTVAVLDRGRLIDHGRQSDLAARPGPFRTLLDAAATQADSDAPEESTASDEAPGSVGGVRRQGDPPAERAIDDGPTLRRGVLSLIRIHPTWGLLGAFLFLTAALTGAFGVVTAALWGHVVAAAGRGDVSAWLLVGVVVSLLVSPLLVAGAGLRYTRWWVAGLLRVRTSVLLAQTDQHRLPRTPPGEIVARALDADRFIRYADRWVDVVNGLIVVVVTTILAGSLLAGLVLMVVMLAAAAASAVGRPFAGRSAAAASATRAAFGRALVSVLESARTIKLAAATEDAHRHLTRTDSGRVDAAVREHRIQSILIGVPVVLVYAGVVAAWAVYLAGGWGLATALLVSGSVIGFDWFGRVAGAVITEAPGTRAWQRVTARFAGGRDLMAVPSAVDLLDGTSPPPASPARVPLRSVSVERFSAVHADGTVGATGIDLRVDAGELVLLLGQVGSGKSSLLSALAGLIDHTGVIRWNGEPVLDTQTFLRPGQVAHVAQVPRVLSGTFAENIRVDHDRRIDSAVDDARLAPDVAAAGGVDAVIGHRGVRLSGGQVQRLALARALASEPELLLADDVSSALDAATEVELWRSLRERGTAVLGATSKRAALAQADRVVVLVDGTIAESGPWSDLSARWGHLAG